MITTLKLTLPVHLHSKWWYSVHVKSHDMLKFQSMNKISTYQLVLILDEHWLYRQLGQERSLLETNQCCSICCGA